MIQIYSRGNTNYEANGDMTLFPEMCEHSAELNGLWMLEMTTSIDDEGRWKYIEPEAVLSVPTFMGKNQLFRISDEIEKNDTNIMIKAYPIFMDTADDHFLLDVRPTDKNGQEALDEMLKGSKYSGKSDIAKKGTAYFVRRNLISAINGDDEPTFVKVWGGEVLYDNFTVIINQRAGADNGFEVRYGKNMESVTYKIKMSDVVTRIVPVAYNNRTLSTGYVDSPLIGHYAKIYTREIKFEDVKMRQDISSEDEEKGAIICDSQEELDAALIKKCEEQYSLGVDLMKVTITVDMIDLFKTEEYKKFKDLEKVTLGDTVRCYNTRLDISTEQRVIKMVWDCIENKAKSIVLGDYEQNYFDKTIDIIQRVESAIKKDGSVTAEKVQGILDGIRTQLKLQSTVAHKVEGRVFMIEDLDPKSPLYGCIIGGTQGIQISRKRTEDGKDWDWTTAVTANGIIADAIITGIISDKGGNNYWNLDTGKLRLSGEFESVDANGIGVKLLDAMLYFLYENHELGTVVAVPSLNLDGSVAGGILDLWASGAGEIMFRIGEDRIWSMSADFIEALPFTGAYTGTVTINGVNLKFTHGILYGVS